VERPVVGEAGLEQRGDQRQVRPGDCSAPMVQQSTEEGWNLGGCGEQNAESDDHAQTEDVQQPDDRITCRLPGSQEGSLLEEMTALKDDQAVQMNGADFRRKKGKSGRPSELPVGAQVLLTLKFWRES